MGKTWIHYYTPESNCQSAEWTANDVSQSAVDSKSTKLTKNATVDWQDYGICILRCTGYNIYQLT